MERKHIAQHIRNIAKCKEEDSNLFAQLFNPHHLKKWGEMNVGQEHFRSIFFVYSGIVQLSHQTIINRQRSKAYPATKTIALYQPNELFFYPFANDPNSALYKLHAISPSQLYLAEYPSVERLIKKYPEMIKHYVSIGEHYLKQTFHHLELLQQPTAPSRYEYLKDHFGKYFFLIPNESKASYMGISRKHLSRITNTYLRQQKESLPPHRVEK